MKNRHRHCHGRNRSLQDLSARHLRYLSTLILCTAFLVLDLSGCDKSPAPVNANLPNILLITADDLGLQLGCYGDTSAHTPNLDKLAAQGTRYENAYTTQASCSPARSSLFTGLYPHQNGQIGLAHSGYKMKRSIPTLPLILKKAGYQMGVIGKVHVAPGSRLPFDWCRMSDSCGGAAYTPMITRDIKEVARHAGNFLNTIGENPFFLMVNYFDPHRPFANQVGGVPERPLTAEDAVPLPFLTDRSSQKVRNDTAAFYNSVHRLDAGVDLLLKVLHEAGVEQSTMVIFLSDHGPPFGRAKITCYEAGVRIPLIIRWPDHLPAGGLVKELVSMVDLLPTILDAGGIKPRIDLEGRSLLKLSQGKIPDWRSTLVSEFTTHTPQQYNPIRAIRDHRYKYILNLHPNVLPAGKEELYDLQEDPFEFRNLAGRSEYHAVKKRLSSALTAWRERTSDDL